MSDMLNGVGDAMLAGLRLGQQRQHERALQSWIDYASDLEAQLQQTQRWLQNEKELNDAQDDLLRSVKVVLEQEEQQNKKLKAQLKEEAAAHAKHVQNLVAELDNLRDIASKAWKSSISAIAYKALEDLYLRELKATEDPSKFNSLNFQARAKAISDAIKEFKRSGKAVADLPDPDIMPLGFPRKR